MRLCRFNGTRLGIIEGDTVRDVSAAIEAIPAQRWPLELGDPLIANLPAVMLRIKDILPHSPRVALDELSLNSPVVTPSKIIGAPMNYRAHQAEVEVDETIRHGHNIKPIGEWGLILKASTALVGPGDGIVRQFPGERTDHEIELAVVIGRSGKNINRDDALHFVVGYSIGLDITLRGPQFPCFRKSIDSYAVLGPWLVTADEVEDPDALDLSLHVNGALRQRSNTRHLIYDVPRLIEFASSFYTLEPGDIIFTGTPEGVGPICGGDVIDAEIDSIGRFQVTVSDA